MHGCVLQSQSNGNHDVYIKLIHKMSLLIEDQLINRQTIYTSKADNENIKKTKQQKKTQIIVF